MSSLKSYFTYGKCIMCCGINNAYLDGTREDWLKVQKKLRNLEKYDVDGRLKEYVKHVDIIVGNFVDTFDGKPDVNWWNVIMTTE